MTSRSLSRLGPDQWQRASTPTVMLVGRAEELGNLLDHLRDDREHPLRGFSNPRRSQPPFSITLAAWATELAADLDARYGELVRIEVGHFYYPAGTPRSVRTPAARRHLIDPLRVAVRPSEQLEVRSGYDLHSSVSVQNLGEHPFTIRTNGVVQSVIVDPASGEVSGCFAGAQSAKLVRFQADPEQTISIPVLIGSACLRRELGYSVPPGLWAFEVFLDLEEDGRYRTPRMPITIMS
jgi:hypothetical protein